MPKKMPPGEGKGYSLDSNMFRLITDRNPTVVKRILETPVEQIWVSSIVYQEAIGGRLEYLRRVMNDQSSRAFASIEQAHRDLLDTVHLLGRFQVLPYTGADEREYRSLAAKVKRVGPQDCRIGVQARLHGLIIVTRNTSDFEAAGFACEDWSIAPGSEP